MSNINKEIETINGAIQNAYDRVIRLDKKLKEIGITDWDVEGLIEAIKRTDALILDLQGDVEELQGCLDEYEDDYGNSPKRQREKHEQYLEDIADDRRLGL
jgi:chromosome segregation ATPase